MSIEKEIIEDIQKGDFDLAVKKAKSYIGSKIEEGVTKIEDEVTSFYGFLKEEMKPSDDDDKDSKVDDKKESDKEDRKKNKDDKDADEDDKKEEDED